MKIPMKEAILQTKSFTIKRGEETIKVANDVWTVAGVVITPTPYFITLNQDFLVEVEDNYWDEDGRAIRELIGGTKFVFINSYEIIVNDTYQTESSDKQKVYIGNCFKDKDSAEKELERLKQKQQERMKGKK